MDKNSKAVFGWDFDEAAAGCPWLRPTYVGAYAAQSAANLLDPAAGFGSPLVRRLYAYRAAYCQPGLPPASREGPAADPDARLLGSLLHKLAVRGLPAPCSLSLERRLLYDAREAGVLDYSERVENGSIGLECQPLLEGLPAMLTAFLLPELALTDGDVTALLERHMSLCSPAEREFYEEAIKRCSDPRLALMLRPQREFGSMLPFPLDPRSAGSDAFVRRQIGVSIDAADRVDFAIEVPFCAEGAAGTGWLRRVIEVDDSTHSARAAHTVDQARDRALRSAGWEVERALTGGGTSRRWGRLVESVCRSLQDAVPASVVEAAYRLRDLPTHQREAIARLLLLPVAEAQLTAMLARLLYWGVAGGGDEVLIVDSQRIGIAPAVRAACEAVAMVGGIHGIAADTCPHVRTQGLQHGEPTLSPVPSAGGRIELRYYGWPSAQSWEALSACSASSAVVVAAPSCAAPNYLEPLLPAEPRPVRIANGASRASEPADPVRAGLVYLLRNVFRKLAFREGQLPIIERAIALRPAVGLLHTGAGKSLCYQLAALCQPGTVLVVAPLRSLMLDQAENLEAAGIHRVAAVLGGVAESATESRLERAWRERSVAAGGQLFALISPERLQMPGFDNLLRSLAACAPIPFCVVDEAHCISEWGHDFRPSYLVVGKRFRQYTGWGGGRPAVMALTATASRTVLRDIMRELDIADSEAVIEPRTYDRPELQIEIRRVHARARMRELAKEVRRMMVETDAGHTGSTTPALDQQKSPGGRGLVFSLYASPEVELGVPRLAADLRTSIPGIQLETYTGSGRDQYIPEPREDGVLLEGQLEGQQSAGESRGKVRLVPAKRRGDTEAERRRLQAQRRFKRGESPILVATHAFGMGIDIPDIRWVIHALLPRSLEEYSQQIGRAGRDGKPARCVLLFCDDQPDLADELLDVDRVRLEELLDRIKSVRRESRGDAIRTLWFVLSAFIGRDLEKAVLHHVIAEWLEPHMRPGFPAGAVVELPFDALPNMLLPTEVERDREVILERALYRLSLVGAIADYWKDYSANCFLIDLDEVKPRRMYESLRAYLLRYLPKSEAACRMPPEPWDYGYAGAAMACGEAVVNMVYETAAKQRRRALGQMLQAARDGSRYGAAVFRAQLLAYLADSEFSDTVRALSERSEPADWLDLLARIDTPDAAAWVLGACRRALEDNPSHPGLLLLAGVARLVCSAGKGAEGEITAGMAALRRTVPDEIMRAGIAAQIAAYIRRLSPANVDMALLAMVEGDCSPMMARLCLVGATPGSAAFQMATVVTTGGGIG